MTRDEYLAFHKECTEKMYNITAAKNADYTGGANDAFANFKNVEKLDICMAETGFLVRMTDKFSRIRTFIKKGVLQVKDESVEDTILDLANYLILLAGYIRNKKKLAKTQPIPLVQELGSAEMSPGAFTEAHIQHFGVKPNGDEGGNDES